VKHNVSGLVFAEPAEGEYCETPGVGGIGYAHCDDNVIDCGENPINVGGTPSC
jgi:hypothetical protein